MYSVSQVQIFLLCLNFKGDVYLAPMADIFNYYPHVQARESNSGEFFLKHHKPKSQSHN